MVCWAVSVPFVPDRAGFLDLARRGRLAFVYREVLADTDTPVSAYAKLGRGPYSFLLESVVGGDKWAAYSFVGVRPRAVVRARGAEVEVLTSVDGELRVTERVARRAGRCKFLDDYLGKLAPAVPPGLPRFFGGAVGWLGYDAVAQLRAAPQHQARRPGRAGALLRAHRHGGHLRQPARHGEGGRRRRRRRGGSRPRLRRRLRPHRGGAGSAGQPGAAAAGRSIRCPGAGGVRRPRAALDDHARGLRGRGAPRAGVHPGRRRVPGRLLAAVQMSRGTASTRSTSTARCGSSTRRRTCSTWSSPRRW